MTLAQFRTRIAAKLGLDNTASSADQSLVDAWCNEGVIDVLLRTSCRVNPATMTLTSGTNDYRLDATVLLVKDAYTTASSQTYPFEQVSPDRLLEMRRGNTGTSSPTSYYALHGSDLLMVYPTPSAADTLNLYYVPRPTAMSDAAHDPSNATYGGVPVEFHKAIEYFALAQGADYQNDETSAQGQRYTELYEKELRKVTKYVNVKGNTRLPRATVGRIMRRSLPGNDTY